jgi:hypothetical protein
LRRRFKPGRSGRQASNSGFPNSTPNGINNYGQIVGKDLARNSAILGTGGAVTNLNTLIDPAAFLSSCAVALMEHSNVRSSDLARPTKK